MAAAAAAAESGDGNGGSSKMITLISSDGERFHMTEEAAALSEIIHFMIEDGCAHGDGIPIPNVTSCILAKVVEYCNKHAADADSRGSSSDTDRKEDLRSFDFEFMNVDRATLYDLIQAAEYLHVKGLRLLCYQTFVDMLTFDGARPASRSFLDAILTCVQSAFSKFGF